MIILDKGDGAINRPRGWDSLDVEEASDGKPKRREAGTVGVEVGRGFRSKKTEAAARGDTRLQCEEALWGYCPNESKFLEPIGDNLAGECGFGNDDGFPKIFLGVRQLIESQVINGDRGQH